MKDVRDPVINRAADRAVRSGQAGHLRRRRADRRRDGMRVPHAVSRELLVGAGATVEDGDLVRVSPRDDRERPQDRPASFSGVTETLSISTEKSESFVRNNSALAFKFIIIYIFTFSVNVKKFY